MIMGRLFWKFFLFIWLGQMLAVAGTAGLFWLERQGREAPGGGVMLAGPPPPPPPPPRFAPPLRGGASDFGGAPRHQPPPAGPRLPVLPLIAGFLASVGCAAALAWYFATPIRRLKAACDGLARGEAAPRASEGLERRHDELADLGRDFDRMAAQVERTLLSQRQLLHDVSHEMRSPLARLQAAIGLLRQQPARGEALLPRIEREGERLDRLVGEILMLSRLEAGACGVPETVDLAPLIDEVADDAGFEGAERGIAVHAACPPGMRLVADPALLRRALDNVVRNALRHSPPGGRVELSVDRLGGGGLQVRVADQGPGVRPSDLGRIFEPFFRSTAEGKGSGLGLTIAQRVAIAFGGAVWAENLDGGGLRVTFEFPAAPPSVQAPGLGKAPGLG